MGRIEYQLFPNQNSPVRGRTDRDSSVERHYGSKSLTSDIAHLDIGIVLVQHQSASGGIVGRYEDNTHNYYQINIILVYIS
ncbi:hypothetical protein GCM10019996_21430 [Lentilactobacillus parakefiri]